MSSHRRRVRRFSRKTTAKTALIRGLVQSVVEHGRIKTTVEKAKETRRHVEKAVTLAKKGDLASRRLLLSRYPHKDTVSKLMGELTQRFNGRPGGYTRVIKIGVRPGDKAEMAFLEFVDYDYKKAATPEGAEKKASTAKTVKKPGAAKAATTKKKSAKTEKAQARA